MKINRDGKSKVLSTNELDKLLKLLPNPKHKVIKIKDKIKISGMNWYKLIII